MTTKYKVETCKPLLKDGYQKEIFFWTIDDILIEVNRDRSDGWIDYDKSDWEEGWLSWCEGDWYTIKELIEKGIQ